MINVQVTDEFKYWLKGLKNLTVKGQIQMRIDRAEEGNFGNWKFLREGVCEMKIDVGPGYRLYFTKHGQNLIILLAGGNKSSQDRDIKLAIELAKSIKKGVRYG
jgi:putative addiction module killer protein